MNYTDTVNWMFAQLPMYQNKGKRAYKADLSNTLKLAEQLNNPETKFRSIHVAGTNGKGSTSHMIASILQESGYKVGLYTSPHLKDFRERIKINGHCISKQFVMGFVKRHKSFFESESLSFFEMTVGMAFEYFAKKQVDIAVIEVGLGGRLDSTNIIVPEVSVITNIGFDHTQFLGDTLPLIAKEKAGIIKENVPVVIGETQAETEDVFRQTAIQKRAPILFADQEDQEYFESDLIGKYQDKNKVTVFTTIQTLIKQGYTVSDSDIINGFKHVVQNTGLLGRWQILQQSPLIVCDTAHNVEGLTYTLQQLMKTSHNSLHFVLGFVSDKSLAPIIDLFPTQANYYFCRPSIPRGLDAHTLKDQFSKKALHGHVYDSVEKAYLAAKKEANPSDVIYVGGSTFVVAEIL